MNYEKVSINIDGEKLACLDLLIDHGFFANRSDFINQALEEKLQKHQSQIDRLLELQQKEAAIDENQWFIGVQSIGKEYLEKVREQEKHIKIRGFGVLYFEPEVDLDLIRSSMDSVEGRIKIHSSPDIIEYLQKKK